MNGIPDLYGSHALWALVRVTEIAFMEIVSLEGLMFSLGFAVGLAYLLRDVIRSRIILSDTGEFGQAATAASGQPQSAYARLSQRIPDRELRERLITEMTNSGQAASRAEAIEFLLVSSIPAEMTRLPDMPSSSDPSLMGSPSTPTTGRSRLSFPPFRRRAAAE